MTRSGLMVCLVAVLCCTPIGAQEVDPYFSPASSGAAAPANASRTGESIASTAARDPGVAYINTREFWLPFQVHDAETLELRLFVSRDRGANWEFNSRYNPQQQGTQYRVPDEGEFWFYLHALTRTNQAPIPANFQNPLRLVVDSRRPILDASAENGDSGGIVLSWSIDDPHLDVSSLRVQVRPKVSAGPPAKWEDVSLGRLQPGEDPLRRSIMIWPPGDQRVLEYLFAVSDFAGNQSEVIRELQLPWQASTPDRSGALSPTTPAHGLASSQEFMGPQNIPWETSNSVSQTPREPERSAFVPSEPEATNQSWGTTVPQRDAHPETRIEQAQRLPSMVQNSAGDSEVRALPASSTTIARPPLASEADRSGEEPFEELPPPISSREDAVNGFDSPRFAPPSSRQGSSSEVSERTPYSGPMDEFAQIINTTRFRLSYDVDSVGTQGVAKVQLWATENGGDTWAPVTEDPDCQSPISVELPGEGAYGFHLVVTARNGLAGEEPRAGQTPDMWVVVDTTSPEVEMVDALIGQGADYGKLILRWRATDTHLAKRPVTLKYSESANGPWQVIAAGLENTGSYSWTIVPALPRYFYVRVEASDRGGNVGSDVSPLPVDLSSFVPRGNLRGFVADPAADR